jgi:ADP-heptose:LPS heptosyltransferase
VDSSSPKNILVVAITRMGDMLQASPTLVGFKEQHPDAKITVLIEKNFASICDGIPGIDEIYSIDLSLVVQALTREGEGIIDAYKYFDSVLADLRAKKFDRCINMASSAYTAVLLKLLDVQDNRGWNSDDEGFRIIENPWAMLFAAFVYHSNRDFNSINLVDILRASSGVHEHPRSLKFNVTEQARASIDGFFDRKSVKRGNGPIITMQAGASQGKRQWLPSKFGFLARLLIENLGATVILTGSKSESPISDAIMQHYSHERLVSAVGETNLNELAALLDASDLLITGDTGTMHLAVAVGTPVVALFLASALAYETGPYSEGNFILQPQIHCNPCNPNLPCSRPDCHDQITPELVAYLTENRLNLTAEEVREFVISPEIADPKEIAVYGSYFDEEGFLDLKPLNGTHGRKGFSHEFYQAARDSYRRVWKSEFGKELGLTEVSKPNASNWIPEGEIENKLSEIISICQQAEQKVNKLETYIRDTRVSAQQLGEANLEIIRTDRSLEDIGLSYGAVGALVRMFVMERENIRGDDPIQLTASTRQLYRNLSRRSLLFWERYREVPKE